MLEPRAFADFSTGLNEREVAEPLQNSLSTVKRDCVGLGIPGSSPERPGRALAGRGHQPSVLSGTIYRSTQRRRT
jgi:hypothetical protein